MASAACAPSLSSDKRCKEILLVGEGPFLFTEALVT